MVPGADRLSTAQNNQTMKIPVKGPTRPMIRYHGGKWMLAKWIISHFPEHRIYVEPFGGAASVLLRKKRSYSEVYNDLDSDVYNLFKAVRDSGNVLRQKLELTPYSREEFDLSFEKTGDIIEDSRRMIVRSYMGFGSAAATGRSTGFRSNSNRSGTTPAHDWKNYPAAMDGIIKRLQGVVIENREAIPIMEKADSPLTLHYVDPPYVKKTRYMEGKTFSYNHEMEDAQHVILIEYLKTLKGYVVLSGYDNEIYNDMLPEWGKYQRAAYSDGAGKRKEVLWMNKDMQAQTKMKF